MFSDPHSLSIGDDPEWTVLRFHDLLHRNVSSPGDNLGVSDILNFNSSYCELNDLTENSITHNALIAKSLHLKIQSLPVKFYKKTKVTVGQISQKNINIIFEE